MNKKIRIAFNALAVLALGLWGPPRRAQAAATAGAKAFVEKHGAGYGLSLDADGDLAYQGRRAFTAAALGAKALGPAARARIELVVAKLGGREPDLAFAPVLKSMLGPGSDGRLGGEPLYARTGGEGDALTPFGRNILMDLLTADDGSPAEALGGAREAAAGMTPESVLARLRKEGHLLQGLEAAAASAEAGTAFDGAGAPAPQLVFPMERFGRWRELEQGKVPNLFKDPGTGELRLVVAGKNAARSDRYKVLGGEEERAIYEETGLDGALISAHGAKAVRVVDNLVEISVPAPAAARLGSALEMAGIHSAPSLAAQAGGAATEGLARGRFPLRRLIPIPGEVFRRLAGRPRARSIEAKDLLKADALWNNGMEGEGTVVGVIDTGLDRKHPDFAGRLLGYIDLVSEGKDAVGHGTHVAGLTLGDGTASSGLYKGMAPKAKLVVIQIFNGMGAGASEMSVLAAMKIVSSLPKGMRPDVVNMSLGINNPIGNNLHSSSLLASYMALRNNIVMAIAAGNSGPKGFTIGAPGNARHALTVTGIDKERRIPFFPSRGPIVNWPFKNYNKPDIATVAGGVNRENPCKYAPGGLIAAKSSEENFPMSGGDACNAPGNSSYRYMTGTSMATPLAAGIAADVVGFLKSKGVPYTADEVKALMMETADDLGRPSTEQGAGLVNGERLAQAVKARAEAGAPVGNVALLAASRLGGFERWYLARRGLVSTPAGLLDTGSGHVVNSAAEVEALSARVKVEVGGKNALERIKLKIQFALSKGVGGGKS